MADSKRYANHRKDLVPTFLVSNKTKWNGEKPHTQIETPPKLRPTAHPLPSFARHVFLDVFIVSKGLKERIERK